jgi:hypothetical protein
MTVQGYAAKGTLIGAKVQAYEILADGTPADTSSATGITDNDGNFTLSPALSKSKRYVLKVTPIAGTVHVDEIAGNQNLYGTTFMMSAVSPAINGAATSNVTVNITPFSHQEVTAASTAGNGKLTPQNLLAAKTMIVNLYGFDPVIASKSGRNSGLLYAVSDMANKKTGSVLGLDCFTKSGADATICVVDALAKSAKLGSVKLSITTATGSIDVSSDFKTSLNNAVTAGQLNKTDSDAVTAKLQCTTDCTTLVTLPTLTANDKDAIEQAKAVLNEIATDLTTMFSKDGAVANPKGAFNQQAYKFANSVVDFHTSTLEITKNIQAMELGARLYRDVVTGVTPFKSGPVAGNYVGHIEFSNAYFSNTSGIACSLYQNQPSVNATLANSKANTNYVGCSSLFGILAIYDQTNNTTTFNVWRHDIALTPVPQASDNAHFTYKSSAKKTSWVCPGSFNYGASLPECGTKSEIDLQLRGWNGNVALTTD